LVDRLSEWITFGVADTAVSRNLVRVQEKGQVTLLASARKRLGLEKSGFVAVVETPEGVLITPQAVVATRALAEIAEALKDQGVSLEDMIESVRETREELFREQFGHLDTDGSWGCHPDSLPSGGAADLPASGSQAEEQRGTAALPEVVVHPQLAQPNETTVAPVGAVEAGAEHRLDDMNPEGN